MVGNIQLSNEDYPGLYQTADAASISSQRTCYRLLFLYLYVLIIGSLLAFFSGDSKLYAFLAALSFLGSLFLSVFVALKRYDRTWYSARAVAESVKTRAWRYMMRSEPYEESKSKDNPKKKFLSDMQEILNQNREVTKELCDESATRDAISTKMEQVRALALEDRAGFYKSRRIEDQRDWYGRKAKMNKDYGRTWFLFVVVLNACAAISALLRIAYPCWKYFPTTVFAVAAAAAISWIQARRFNDLSTSYSLAAHEIAIIQSRAKIFMDEEEFSRFVNDTENAFSREHTQWIARKNS